MTFLKQILADADAAPDLFHFYGPMEATQLTLFLEQRKWRVPGDLFEVWCTIGGMDFFADEVLFGPVVHHSWQDHLDEYNDWVKQAGNESRFVLVHEGIGNTMIDQETLEVKMFENSDYGDGPSTNYGTCLEWYINEMRNEYTQFWPLPPALPEVENNILHSRGGRS